MAFIPSFEHLIGIYRGLNKHLLSFLLMSPPPTRLPYHARQMPDRSGSVGLSRARSGLVGHGWAWSGMVGHGRAWSGLVGHGRSGLVGEPSWGGPFYTVLNATDLSLSSLSPL